MVKSKSELLAARNGWMQVATQDLRNKMIQFMERTGASGTSLADALGITNAEINTILNGNGDVKISTLASLLIGTGNAIQIVPESMLPPHPQIPPRTPQPTPQAQRDAYGRFSATAPQAQPTAPQPTAPQPTPQPQGINLNDLNRNELLHLASQRGIRTNIRMTRQEIINLLMANQPQRPTATAPQAQPTAPQPTPQPQGINLNDLSRAELVNLADQIGLGSQITSRSTRAQIINLLMANQPQRPTATAPQAQPTTPQPSDERLAQLLLSELQSNPRLRSVVEGFMRNGGR